MTAIQENIHTLLQKLPPEVTLVAVSKFQPLPLLEEAYAAGVRDFGENRPQEMALKQAALPQDIRWHFIGHLQTNKVKQVVGKAFLIHSMDSVRLLDAAERQARLLGCEQAVLLQAHIAMEETKGGFSLEEIEGLFAAHFCPETGLLKPWPHLRLCGLMGMASFVDKPAQVDAEFASLQGLFVRLRETYFPQGGFDRLSMGMSGDYPLALVRGATLVRIGSAIFPPRGH